MEKMGSASSGDTHTMDNSKMHIDSNTSSADQDAKQSWTPQNAEKGNTKNGDFSA